MLKRLSAPFAATVSLLALFLATSTQAAPTQGQLDSFAHDLGYRFTVLSNHATEGCPTGQTCFASQIDLTLPQTLPDAGWSLYVSLVAKFTGLPDDHFDFTHIQGGYVSHHPQGRRYADTGRDLCPEADRHRGFFLRILSDAQCLRGSR